MTLASDRIRSIEAVAEELGIEQVYSTNDLSTCFVVGGLDIFVEKAGRVSMRLYDLSRKVVWTWTIPMSFESATFIDILRSLVINEVRPQSQPQEGQS